MTTFFAKIYFSFLLLIGLQGWAQTVTYSLTSQNNNCPPVSDLILASCNGDAYKGDDIVRIYASQAANGVIQFTVNRCDGNPFNGTVYLKQSSLSSDPDVVCGQGNPLTMSLNAGQTQATYTYNCANEGFTSAGTKYFMAVYISNFSGTKYHSGKVVIDATENLPYLCPTCTGFSLSLSSFAAGNEGFCAAKYLCNKGIIISNQSSPPTNAVSKQDIAKMVVKGLLNDADIANSANLAFPSNDFPTPAIDLVNLSSDYAKYAKVLTYLQFLDDKTPFPRKETFVPTQTIKREDAVKILLEAWNVDENQVNPLFTTSFTDVASSPQLQYIKRAHELGIIRNAGSGLFRPSDNCTREEFFIMLYRIREEAGLTRPDIMNVINYFIPANITPTNALLGQGLAQGNFSHAEAGFSIPDIGFTLGFGFNYESIRTEMPALYHLIEPFGSAWNHPYNAYIYRLEITDDFDGKRITNPQLFVTWGDGSTDVYNNNIESAPTPVTNDNKDQIFRNSATQYSIRKKDYSVYTFDRQGTENNLWRLTSIADRYGNQLNIHYKTIPNPHVLFLGPVSNTEISYQIDYVESYNTGRRITFSYNADNQISQIIFPGETANTRNLSFGYTNKLLTSYTNARGKTSHYTYDTQNESTLLKAIVLPKGNKIQIGYTVKDNKANAVQVLSSANAVVSDISISGFPATYANGKAFTTTVTDNRTQLSSTNSFNADAVASNIISTQASVTIARAFGDASNPSSPTAINQNGTIYTYEYYPNGNLKKRIQPNGATEQFAYDAFNNLTSYTDPKGNITLYTYSADGRFLQNIQQPSSSGTLTQSYTYYTNGLPQTSVNHEGITAGMEYDVYGNLTKTTLPVLNLQSTATYDYAGRIKTSTNAKNQTTTYLFDLNDNKVGEKDAQNHNTTYDYDDNDNLALITNAKGQQTTFMYDEFDRVKTETFEGKTKTYTYNATTGLLDQFQKPSGNAFTYAYDPTSKRLKSNGYITNIDYNGNNLLASIKGGNNPNHLLSEFLYDQNQRLTSYKDHYSNTVSYAYDLNGNISQINYPFGRTVYYEYDQANRLRKVFLNTTTGTPIAEYVYTGSRLSYVQYGNGVRTTYGYDNAGRPNAQTTKTNNGTGNTICDYGFVMDNLGNHTQENLTEPFATLPTPPAATTNYTYTLGNRIQTAGNTSFAFDNDGNTTSKTGYTFGYDLEDNLTSAAGNATLSYEYDAFGNRRRATRNGEETRYVLDINGDMADVLVETDANNGAKAFYIHGLGLVARLKINGQLQYYHPDFRGSVIALTDASQTITHKYQYDEFGNLTNSQEPANDRNDFRYVGTLGVMHETNDLTYMRARYYDPTIGRFNSEDPIWATNLYPYAGNNGVMNVDAGGEEDESFIESYFTSEGEGQLIDFIKAKLVAELKSQTIHSYGKKKTLFFQIRKRVEKFKYLGEMIDATKLLINAGISMAKGDYDNVAHDLICGGMGVGVDVITVGYAGSTVEYGCKDLDNVFNGNPAKSWLGKSIQDLGTAHITGKRSNLIIKNGKKIVKKYIEKKGKSIALGALLKIIPSCIK